MALQLQILLQEASERALTPLRPKMKLKQAQRHQLLLITTKREQWLELLRPHLLRLALRGATA